MKYSREDIEWILRNLLELRQGVWPDPRPYDYMPSIQRRCRRVEAHFNNPCDAAGCVEARLDKCGRDGFIAKLSYAYGESDQYIAEKVKLKEKQVTKGVETAIRYISWKWPKDGGYGEYKYHRRGR